MIIYFILSDFPLSVTKYLCSLCFLVLLAFFFCLFLFLKGNICDWSTDYSKNGIFTFYSEGFDLAFVFIGKYLGFFCWPKC